MSGQEGMNEKSDQDPDMREKSEKRNDRCTTNGSWSSIFGGRERRNRPNVADNSEEGGDAIGERGPFCMVKGAGFPVDPEARAGGEFGDDVKVDVHDELVGVGPVVLEDVVGGGTGGVEDGAADTRESTPDGGGGIVGEFVEVGFGFFGNDKRVARSERIDIEEGEDLLVFVDAVAGDLGADDPGEDGVAHDRGYEGRRRGWRA